MTKREICTTNKSLAYYSGFGGFEIKKIEYGIVKLHGYKIPLDECIRIN